MELAERISGPEMEAVFLLDGGGLLVQGAVLGRRLHFVENDTRVTISLPDPEHVPPELGQVSEQRGSEKAAHLVAWNPRTREIAAAVVDTFEVRVGVTLSDETLKTVVEQAFPVGLEVAERFMAWMRTQGRQYWLPTWHEGLEPAAPYGRLVLAGTDKEVDPNARWYLGEAMSARSPERAASPRVIDDIVAKTERGADPLPEEVLLADAIEAADTLSVTAMWTYERRDTARAVLLAAIAAEVKIKRTLLDAAPREFRDLLDVIVDNPREVSIAAGQLLNKPMKATFGRSLREDDKQLFKDVTDQTNTKSGLFPLRNRVAHHGYEPTLAEAQEAVLIAFRLFLWLDHFTGSVA
jgi:hypothetical protein